MNLALRERTPNQDDVDDDGGIWCFIDTWLLKTTRFNIEKHLFFSFFSIFLYFFFFFFFTQKNENRNGVKKSIIIFNKIILYDLYFKDFFFF